MLACLLTPYSTVEASEQFAVQHPSCPSPAVHRQGCAGCGSRWSNALLAADQCPAFPVQAGKRGAKQKGSATAPTLSQAAVSSAVDLTQENESEARRQAEVAVTSELISTFQQHTSTWESLEVGSFIEKLIGR